MVLMVEDTLGFVSPAFQATQGRTSKTASSSTSPSSNKQTCLFMLDQPPVVSALTLVAPILSYSFAIPPFAALATAAPNLIDPIVEAELLNDMAHVALDCTTFFGPATTAIRLMAILGRLFVIGADYLPDHTIHLEEVIFQAFMLAIASLGFVQSALPTLRAGSAQTTIRDGRVFIKTFSRAGMTWMQYKAMAAVSALEWIEVESGKIILSEEALPDSTPHDYFYFLYNGTVTVHSQGQHLGHCFKPSLVGEMQFARQLDGHDSDEDLPKTTIKAGDQGATLLRIQSSKLIELMKNDDKLAKSIRSLIVKGMQQKLSTAMRKNMASV
jgi:hypothetical protein